MSDSGNSFYNLDNKHTSYWSPIPQFDGPVANLNDSIDVLDINVRTRIANFELNNEKQADKILKDSNNPDFTISCNDNNRNININCNSGFYLQVAKPTLLQLATGSIDSIDGIDIECQNVTKNKDLASHEYNLTLFFIIIEGTGKRAKVTIHSHHSSRLVQVQGGSILKSKSTAALWFVNNVIYNKFKSLAESKSIQIFEINKKINESCRPKEKCASCNKVFDLLR